MAVVGTMKAGKSTTINAIVGREILPNRNRPMTALPTLICHNSQRTEPLLSFDNQDINIFRNKVRKFLKTHKDFKSEVVEIQELAQWIKGNHTFNKEYEGAENIFDFFTKIK
ncbi:MAG: dynamin family protein [Arcobacter sp.]|nr:dynamin family protein [Arcobacter sp.]